MEKIDRSIEVKDEMFYLNQAEKALRDGDEQSCVDWFFEGVQNAFSDQERLEFQKLIQTII